MLTLLQKFPDGGEEITEVASISYVPAAPAPNDAMDCAGAAHVAFQALSLVSGQEGYSYVRRVAHTGIVFVMNGTGATIAMYRFDVHKRAAIAA